MENHTSLEKRAEAKELIKQAFREQLEAQGLSVSDLPALLEKQATPAAAAPVVVNTGRTALAAGAASLPYAAGALGAGTLTAAPKILEFFGQWAPVAMLGAGALAGTGYAFAESTHRAKSLEHERKQKRVDKLLRQAAMARKARKKSRQRERKRRLKQLELQQHSGGDSNVLE
jgi:hypothetical protein